MARTARRFKPKKLYRIGEVMRYSGLSRGTVNNYTMLRLITEQERTEAGHRLYGEDVFRQLEQIDALKKTKTLREIQDLFFVRKRKRDVSSNQG